MHMCLLGYVSQYSLYERGCSAWTPSESLQVARLSFHGFLLIKKAPTLERPTGHLRYLNPGSLCKGKVMRKPRYAG